MKNLKNCACEDLSIGGLCIINFQSVPQAMNNKQVMLFEFDGQI